MSSHFLLYLISPILQINKAWPPDLLHPLQHRDPAVLRERVHAAAVSGLVVRPDKHPLRVAGQEARPAAPTPDWKGVGRVHGAGIVQDHALGLLGIVSAIDVLRVADLRRGAYHFGGHDHRFQQGLGNGTRSLSPASRLLFPAKSTLLKLAQAVEVFLLLELLPEGKDLAEQSCSACLIPTDGKHLEGSQFPPDIVAADYKQALLSLSETSEPSRKSRSPRFVVATFVGAATYIDLKRGGKRAGKRGGKRGRKEERKEEKRGRKRGEKRGEK